jgi:TonB family protein
MNVSTRIFVLFLLPALFPVLARAQAAAGPMIRPPEPAGVYEDSAAGLRLQLQDALAAARNHDRSRLESFVRQMEIPDYEAWFMKSYGQLKGESWARSYGREIANRENDLNAAFLEFGTETGEFATRQVNDAPSPGMEAGMISELQQPVDVFYAGWKRRDSPANSKDEPIGYFVFLEGRFRWDSTIVLLKIQQDETKNRAVTGSTLPGPVGDTPGNPSNGGNDLNTYSPGVRGVGYPTCTYCPGPEYTKEARAKHIEGVVVLQVIVQPDGRATDIQIVKSVDPGLAQKAVEAVSRWQFNPARRGDGEPVPVKVPIEVTFRLLK